MVKNMKFLICGLGSIGKRCLENLELLNIPCENISVLRTRKGTPSFGDKILEEHKNKHHVFNNLNDAFKQKPNAVLITNPTSLHIPVALKASKTKFHLFITKPLSHNLKGVNELAKISKKNNLVLYVSYQLRFHPHLRQIKQWLDEKKIGNVVSATAELSERIVNLHPWENYKISYIGRKDLGGGPILSFSHEIDYLYWLFGMPKWVFAAGGTLGNLNINTEDTVKTIMQFPKTLVSLHFDYLKSPARRFLQITGTKGRIYWDYIEKKLELIPLEGEKTTIFEPKNYDRNSMHIDELKHFINCIKNKKQPLIGLRQGKDVLKICLAIKKSMQEKKPVNL